MCDFCQNFIIETKNRVQCATFVKISLLKPKVVCNVRLLLKFHYWNQKSCAVFDFCQNFSNETKSRVQRATFVIISLLKPKIVCSVRLLSKFHYWNQKSCAACDFCCSCVQKTTFSWYFNWVWIIWDSFYYEHYFRKLTLILFLRHFTIGWPNVRFGTKCPSMTSRC